MKGTEKNDQVDPNAASENGSDTVLHYATLSDHTEIYKLLLPKMTPEAINTADNPGNTALHAAAIGGPVYVPNNTDAELYGNTDEADLNLN